MVEPRRSSDQAAMAREELGGAMVDDDASINDYNTYEVSENQLIVDEDEEDSDDPAVLLGMLEEALSRAALNTPEPLDPRQVVEQPPWDRIRRWLWSHATLEERQAAAYIRGSTNDVTALHLVCKLHHPPTDIVQALLEAAPDVSRWTDAQGWLPLHHACANGASPQVLECLIEAFPEGKLQQDHERRTPLHFLTTRNTDYPQQAAQSAQMLVDTGAAELADRSGMLPMHYACAYGSDSVVLQVLAQAYPASLTAPEHKGRTPMHLAMVNAHRDTSPAVLKFLLSQPEAAKSINTRDQDSYLPLHLLALGLRGYKFDDVSKRNNVCDCLRSYLEAEPYPTPDFLTALQKLPDWLRDTAVVSKHVRNVLNTKIVQPFPTMILMLDGYMLILLILSFGRATSNYIDTSSDPEIEDDSGMAKPLVYVGALYFLWREIIQIWSLVNLGSFSSWYTDPTNLLDISVIVLVFYYVTAMTRDDPALSMQKFQSGVAFTQGILYMAVIVYLKSTYVDFAVFVGGVLYVVKKLSAFLIAVGVILLAFAQMFYFVYTKTDLCNEGLATDDPLYDGEMSCTFAHCTFQRSLLKVYTMMMGEIGDETRYSVGSTSLVGQILYVGYAFLVVILLSNVLIAIVTDSYEIIQNDRAAVVFWSNRLDFVAEMDAITYGVQRKLCFRGKKMSSLSGAQEAASAHGASVANVDYNLANKQRGGPIEFFNNSWKNLMLLFDPGLYEEIDLIEAWVYNFLRILAIVIVIPLWLALGAMTAGCLWPPQIRELLFIQTSTTKSRAEIEKQKLEQLRTIQIDMKTLKHDFMREMANDRENVLRMKMEVDTLQSEILSDLQQVKELISSVIGD